MTALAHNMKVISFACQRVLPERHVTAQAFTARFESRETGAATTFARYGGQAYSDSCGGERPLQPLVSTLISIDRPQLLF